MDPRQIFLPAVAMVVLSSILLVRMFFERLRQVRAENIRWREIPSASQMAARFQDTRAADNFRNLFEVPVLFYLALVVAFLIAQVNLLTLSLAWIFVASRYLHSVIHCTNNRLKYRFPVYLLGWLVLWIFWGVLAIGLLH
jgi:hypothetical protein